jgi:hypothetical protein
MGRVRDYWNGVYSGVSGPAPTHVSTPFSAGAFNPIIASDIFGIDVAPVTKDEALKVPAVYKARSILHALIVPRPLVALRGDTRIVEQPSWLYRSDSGIPTQHRTAAILDDLIFHGQCLLLVVKRGTDGFPLDVVHVARERWSVQPDGSTHIDRQPVNEEDIFYIEGPAGTAGLLSYGAEKIRQSLSLDRSATARARNPVPVMEISLEGDTSLTQEESDALRGKVAAARRDPDGAIIITPSGASLNVFGDRATDFFESGRNAIRIDIANMFGLPASMLDSGISSSSLDYSTQEGKRNEVFDYAINYWTTPITSWLSEDRVTPRGTRIRFDFTDLLSTTAAPTGPVTED